MAETQIAQAVQLLDVMLEHFADDRHWTRGRYDDGNGGHCLVGALLHLSRKHGLPRAPVIALLQDAMPRPGLPLVHFNDTCCGSVAEVRSVILKARRLADDHAEQQRAAAAVRTWLLTRIEKKRPAPLGISRARRGMSHSPPNALPRRDLNQPGVKFNRNLPPPCFSSRLRDQQGREETCEARYIAGCDGAHSTVREAIGTGFPGGTYRQLFYVADVEAAGRPLDGELHADLDEADFLAVFPLAGEGRARLIGTVRDERADRADTLKFEAVSDRAIKRLKVDVRRVNWFSTYHVHHRVTEHFRKSRVFLLGDAAHIHSPAGGQGMNTGIGDAINLAWKLAAVLAGHAPDTLLNSYEAERIGFARRLVATTDRVFSFVTAEGRIADIIRTRVAPVLIPTAMAFEAAREYLFRTVSQITLNYRDGPLSVGAAAHVHGGDRLPWVPIGGKDNFEPLAAMNWQIHVYGSAKAQLADWCACHDMPLHIFDWRPEHEAAGLARNALYLLRPDTYVALADPSGGPETLERYFSEQEIRTPLASP